MAFKRQNDDKRKIALVSLIDMAFILLLFFLVTIFVAQLLKAEQKIFVPTPKNEPGRAQILIQLLENNNFVWIDQKAMAIVEREWEKLEKQDSFWPLSPQQKQSIKTEVALPALLRQSPGSHLESRLNELVSEVRESGAKYFVVIRCPDAVPYSKVVHIIKILATAVTIEYGCVGGTLDQIRECRSVKIVREKLSNDEERDNLHIDFLSEYEK